MNRQEAEKLDEEFHKGYAKAAADILEQVDDLEADKMPSVFAGNYGQRVIDLLNGKSQEDDNVEDIFMEIWHEGYTSARNITATINKDAQQDVPSASELLFEANEKLGHFINHLHDADWVEVRTSKGIAIHDLYIEVYNKLNEELESKEVT